jgi:hypothetical protein
MPKIKKSLMILLMIWINSCSNFKKKITRCGIYNETCRCHEYIIGVGRVSESIDYPIKKCNKFIAISSDDFLKLIYH